jgi:hypothetical protein
MSQINANAILDANGGNTATINSMTPTADSLQGFRNRIINGDMRIDQRNAGASVTPTTDNFITDRWLAGGNQASKFSIQQNAGSVTPPVGFTNYLGVTVGASANVTLGTTGIFYINQKIEGNNVADLGWGTANAKTVTFSFWVRSSLTGTFGGSLYNSAANRSYPYSYTISSANTWEQKSITIAGDTSGTWLTNNGVGITVLFALGYGTDYLGTANSWQSGFYGAPTGSVFPISTNSATFYITGVQLEVGSVATPFERRPYELALCQRYFQIITVSGRFNSSSGGFWGLSYQFKVTMRANPTYTDGPAPGNSSVPATNQGVVTGSTHEAGIQWNGAANTEFYAYGRAATFNAEL